MALWWDHGNSCTGGDGRNCQESVEAIKETHLGTRGRMDDENSDGSHAIKSIGRRWVTSISRSMETPTDKPKDVRKHHHKK